MNQKNISFRNNLFQTDCLHFFGMTHFFIINISPFDSLFRVSFNKNDLFCSYLYSFIILGSISISKLCIMYK